MEKNKLEQVLGKAAAERGCSICSLDFNDDDNVFEVTLDKISGAVDLGDCEYVHRAVLDAFDRDIEDYALTVGSRGIPAEEADETLNTIKE